MHKISDFVIILLLVCKFKVFFPFWTVTFELLGKPDKIRPKMLFFPLFPGDFTSSYLLLGRGGDLEVCEPQVLVLVLQVLAVVGHFLGFRAHVLQVVHLHRAGPEKSDRRVDFRKRFAPIYLI